MPFLVKFIKKLCKKGDERYMKLIHIIKKAIPKKIKIFIKDYLYTKKYGFNPPPRFSDMSGYELLLDTIIQQRLYKFEGDFIEIGLFLGGGYI